MHNDHAHGPPHPTQLLIGIIYLHQVTCPHINEWNVVRDLQGQWLLSIIATL